MMKVYPFGAGDGFSDSLEAPAFLVREKDELWLIDCPPQANFFLREAELSALDLTAILITHLHNDHVGGLVDLIQMRMLCLSNRELMKRAGYYQNIAVEVLPIYIFGYEREWWNCLEKLIDLNCPRAWGDWRNFHKVILLDGKLEQDTLMINGLSVAFRRTKHDVPCYGFKIEESVAISGDTPYDEKYEGWLCDEVGMVFHEAGFGGSHLKPEFFSRVIRQHHRLIFYHVPSGARWFMRVNNLPVAEKGWLNVERFYRLNMADNWTSDWD